MSETTEPTISQYPEKAAPADHPIDELIARRWSPIVFEDRAVEREKILS